ncbi:MAG TPA: hypothetical protein VJ861_02920 [Treponemataceae bacterium]|nr:hypothetical protein [Treponemataceae bacterium]
MTYNKELTPEEKAKQQAITKKLRDRLSAYLAEKANEIQMAYTNDLRTIEILIGIDTTGYNTYEENSLFVKALRSALEAEFPNTNISVEMSENSGKTWTWSENRFCLYDNDVAEKINLIKTRVWEKMEY